MKKKKKKKKKKMKLFDFLSSVKRGLVKQNLILESFSRIQLNLKKWLITKFPSDTEIRSMEENKVLGIRWNKCHDHIEFDLISFSEKFSQKPTKRNVIETTASFFDPLGLVKSDYCEIENPISRCVFRKIRLG